jgi:hypothetical protein
MNRREFLKSVSLGAAGMLFADRLLTKSAHAANARLTGLGGTFVPSFVPAEHLIWINLQGGASHLDTFDPKPNTKNGGSFKAISTRIAGMSLVEHLPRLAENADKFLFIRSMTSKEGNHDRARYLLHTGYAPQGTVQHPPLGSVIWKEKITAAFDLPHFVAINRPTTKAGLLGLQYDPFFVQSPLKPLENLGDKTVPEAQVASRLALLDQINGQFEKTYAAKEVALHRDTYSKANRLVNSPLSKAFDLSLESDAMREAYGKTEFGQGCLMATRLVQYGVKVVEVSLDGWDTHINNFETLSKKLCPNLDQALSALVIDLAQRNLLDKTLVVCTGEFGRTPTINKDNGRDHFPQAFSMCMAGGGIKTGRVIGATSDDGTKVIQDPVTVPDFYATLMRIFDIDADTTNFTPESRPIRLVDKTGKVVEKVFA